MTVRTKVLIVDDSPVIRHALTKELAKHADLEVVGAAPDPYAAREMMFEHEPDVLSLDLEMPRMNGLQFLKKIIKHRPIPVVVVSSLTTSGCRIALECLEAGAVDVLSKPGPDAPLAAFGKELAARLRVAAKVDVRALVAAAKATTPPPCPPASSARRASPPRSEQASLQRRLIVLGTSTGGPEALRRVLTTLPAEMPPIVIVQHMPKTFIESLAARLDGLSALTVRAAEEGDPLLPGTVLIAPGDRHARVVKAASGGAKVELADTPAVCGHRPSVEVLFESAARLGHVERLGVLLTGMGKDGAGGLASLRRSGAHTIAQDEASSVVFGMPREAIELGAAAEVLSLERIPARMLDWACGRVVARG